ncbi:MAG: ParB N-terminal domain-containing protein [Anaerolineaceae bacterium]|nr:ParB N-terminal domain-containing protein [Anaerolineaceae bacterium]
MSGKAIEYTPELIELEWIAPNPYQTRLAEDPEHVERIARSIFVRDLIQIPIGRRSTGGIQLAFGHTRLAAFKLLNRQIQRGDLPVDDIVAMTRFAVMPVIVRELDDLTMFELAVRENSDRKDLNVIEQARAMQVYRDEFGKTSSEIGALFGLGGSAVRNKLRLLKLPGQIQDHLAGGQITEGAARSLLVLYDISTWQLEAGETLQDERLRPSSIVAAACAGEAPELLLERIRQMSYTVNRPQPMPAAPPRQTEVTPESWAPSTVSVETVFQESHGTGELPAPSASGETILQGESQTADDENCAPEVEYTPTQPASMPLPRPEPETQPVAETIQKISLEESHSQSLAPQSVQPPQPTRPEADQVTGEKPTEKTPTWAASTITMTLTCWPDDGHPQGRAVMIGARVNQDLPRVAMARQAQITFPEQLLSLVRELRSQFANGDQQ